MEYEHNSYNLLLSTFEKIMSNVLKGIDREYTNELVVNILYLILFLNRKGVFWEILHSSNLFLDIVKIMQNFIVSKRCNEETKMCILTIISEVCQHKHISNYLLYATGMCEWLIESIRINSIEVATMSLVCIRDNFITCRSFKLHASYGKNGLI